jgi:hypothetical protein
MISRFLPVLALAVFSTGMARGGMLDGLDAAQRRAVFEGGQVSVEESVDGKPWPRVRVYQKVGASPEEVAAVFSDYGKAHTFVPDVLSSRIVESRSPHTHDVEYEVEVPILPDERYTARNSLEALPGGGFRVSWKLLAALQTKDAVGNLLIEPHGEGGSVLCYTNLVTPGSSMAGLLRSAAMARMRKTVDAIVEKVELEKRERPADLAVQVGKFRASLGEPAEGAGAGDE